MAALPDRRRVNGPAGTTTAPVYALDATKTSDRAPARTRSPSELRKIFLRTGLTPSASGSAYLELELSRPPQATSHPLTVSRSGLKLTCTVHGPRPLPRSIPFSSQLLLTPRIKFAPFAARHRRGYVPDPSERDLAGHLETALRGVLLGDRWPKSGLDIIITVLEGEEDSPSGQVTGRTEDWGSMTILSGCITVASAAIADAGIECIDLITGGVAALVGQPAGPAQLVLDLCPSEHDEIKAACVIAYSHSKDEIMELWVKRGGKTPDGEPPSNLDVEALVDKAVEAASTARLVLVEALKESTEAKLQGLRLSEAPKDS